MEIGKHQRLSVYQKGFTLVEMMVAMSIFTIIMGITMTSLRLNDKYSDLISVQNRLARQGKKAIDSISEELSLSSSSR